MANFVFNVAKGRVAEFYNRVQTNDPATARLVIIPIESLGLEAQSALEDADTFAAVIAGSTNEQTTLGRKYLTDSDINALSPDDTNNRMDIDIPDITWLAGTGNSVGGLVIAYDPAASLDTAIIPLTYHDFSVTPDGSDIVAVVNAAGFYRAS